MKLLTLTKVQRATSGVGLLAVPALAGLMLLTFKPSALPIPASDWILLAGVFVLFGLVRVWSVFTRFSTFKLLKGARARGALGADGPALTN